MHEMIQAAQDRQKQLDRLIAQHEAEIADFRTEAEKLETFITLAEELFIEQDSEPQPRPRAPQDAAPQAIQHPKPQDAAPHTLQYAKPQEAAPAERPHPAQASGEAQLSQAQLAQRVMPARQPRSD